jgi:hypothetical protein
MKLQFKAFYDWVIGNPRLDGEMRDINLTTHLYDRIAEALHMARKHAASDGRSPTLLDYFLAAEKLNITPQQMTDLSRQDLSGFIVARPHLEEARLPYIRSHGITVRGSKLDRCKLVPMTVVELMAFDSTTTMREVEFVAA